MANEIIDLQICLTDEPETEANWWSLSQMYSAYVSRNELTYAKSPQRTKNFTIHNAEEARYIPTVSFTFNYISREEYQKLMQILNGKGFFVRYYDFELGMTVQRRMYMSGNSIQELYNHSINLVGLLGYEITFVSVFGYEYLDAPNANSTQEERDLWSEENKYHYYYLKRDAIETRVQDMA